MQLYFSVLLIFALHANIATGQTCSWNPFSTSTFYGVKGKPAYFYFESLTHLRNGDKFFWHLGTTPLAVNIYKSNSTPHFVVDEISSNRVIAISKYVNDTKSQHNLTITSLLASDDDKQITLGRKGCSLTRDRAGPVTLFVSYCDPHVFGNDATIAASGSTIKSDEKVVFLCNGTKYRATYFTALCQTDSTWDIKKQPCMTKINEGGQTCSWETAEPSTLIGVVGKSANFRVKSMGLLSDGDLFSWSLDGNNLIVYEYKHNSSLSPRFVVDEISSNRVRASSKYVSDTISEHNLTITSLLASDDGKQITLLREGCSLETEETKPVTLSLSCCGPDAFGSDAASVSYGLPIKCNDEIVFVCNEAMYQAQHFVAKCQANSTWNTIRHACQPKSFQLNVGTIAVILVGCLMIVAVFCVAIVKIVLEKRRNAPASRVTHDNDDLQNSLIGQNDNESAGTPDQNNHDDGN